MEQKSKEEISKLLNNPDNSIVLNTINELRDQGNDNLLEILCQIYIDNEDREIRTSIFQLFCDLKSQKSTEYVMQLIQNANYKVAKQMLISSCWQSRLNYSNFLEIFILMVITESFEISFEAFTVIENLDVPLEEKRKNELIRYRLIKHSLF